MNLNSQYEPRPIRHLERATNDEWRIKVYGISATGERPDPSLVEAAKHVAFGDLPTPAVTRDRYGVGFLIVHEGRDANFVLLDWWFGENMLKQRVYISSLDDPTQLEYTPDGPTACVWELYVLGFERRAWLDAVLRNEHGPDVDAYLSRRCNTTI